MIREPAEEYSLLSYPGGVRFKIFGENYGDTSFFRDKLSKHESFSLIRYGDGEWGMAFGNRYTLAGHTGSEELQADMVKVLKEPKPGLHYTTTRNMYLHEADSNPRKWNNGVGKWLRANDVHIEWTDGSLLHDASRWGRLHEFTDALKARDVVVVGPDHLKKLSFLKPVDWVSTGVIGAYEIKDRLIEQTRKLMGNRAETVFLVFAAMTSEIIIHELHGLNGAVFIDCGSCFDPYAGVKSRGWMSHYKFDEFKRSK